MEYNELLERFRALADVTEEDSSDCIIDEFGVSYSKDGKRLIKGNDIEEYFVKDGTEIICCGAFQDCHELSAIHFPSSLRFIGAYAFHSASLKQLNLNEGLLAIDKFAFAYVCDSEFDLTLPNSLVFLGEYSFMKTSIKTLNIGNSLKKIGYYVFGGCGQLKNIVLNDSVEYIGDCAFAYCGIDTFIIPKSVKEIDGNPFLEIKNIISESDCFTVEDDALYTSDKKRLIACFSNKKEYYVQAPTEIIGDASFKRTDVEEIVLPETVKEIGLFAFGSKLKSVNIPHGVTKISNYAFWGTEIETIELPDSITEIGEGAFTHSHLKTIKLPCNLETIGDSAFSGCFDLESITLPPTIRYIGSDAFNGCNKIMQVIVPKSVSTIGAFAFPRTTDVQIEKESSSFDVSDDIVYSADGKTVLRLNGLLKEVTVKEGVETIGEGAFAHSIIEKIHLPSTLKTIGASAFEDCFKLESPSLPPSLTCIEYCAFNGCHFDSITLHEGISYIGAECFSLTRLKHIKLPSTLKEIEEKQFSCCSDLESVIISSGTERIGDGAFNGCNKLKTIEIPQSVVSIGDAAFRGCRGLVEIHLPPIKEIPKMLFQYDCNLKDIHIPDTVEKIGDYAFVDVKPNYNIMSSKIKELVKKSLKEECDDVIIESNCPF